MKASQTFLGLIPARGGSKGIPGKNIRMVQGKPLVAWTIEQAHRSTLLDRTVLSSDNTEIIRAAIEYGCEVPFRRPQELGADDTPGIAPVLHAIEILSDYDYVVLLQPTSPLRSPEDIDNCISLCLEASAPACVSVTRCFENPHLMFWKGEDLRLNPVLGEGGRIACRQLMPDAFRLNGAIYVAQAKWLKQTRSFISAETVAYEMPAERSLDIDTEEDLKHLEGFLEQRAASGSNGSYLPLDGEQPAFPASENL